MLYNTRFMLNDRLDVTIQIDSRDYSENTLIIIKHDDHDEQEWSSIDGNLDSQELRNLPDFTVDLKLIIDSYLRLEQDDKHIKDIIEVCHKYLLNDI